MTGKAFGLGIGIVIGLIIVYIACKALNSDGRVRTDYDERQKAVRGTAYMYGFYAVLIVEAAMMLLSETENGLSALGIAEHFIPILAGVIVQVVYAIMHDGYFGQNNNTTKYMVFMALVSVFNLGVGFLGLNKALAAGEPISTPLVSLGAGLLFVAVAIALFARKLARREESDEE